MEWAPNGSMRTKHPKGSKVPLQTVVMYVDQIADALQYIHEQKLVHRDIKPENILLGANQEILISDLGIAAIAHETGSIVPQGPAGTLTYMAPEQILEMPRPASDQYSLAIVVYEWLCGNRPFQGSFGELYTQHLSVPPPSLKNKVRDLPAGVEEVVFTALAKDPQQRFSSVRAFAKALQKASQSEYHNAQSSVVSMVPYQMPSMNTLEEQPTSLIHLWEYGTTENIDTVQGVGATQPAIWEPTTKPPTSAEISSESKLPLPLHIPDERIEKVTTPLPGKERNNTEGEDLRVYKNDSVESVSPALHAQPIKSLGSGRGSILKRKWMLSSVILILLVGLVGAIILVSFRSFVSPAPAAVDTRIASKSIELKNTYTISAVTGKPDTSQHQVQARFISYSIPSQEVRVIASGIQIIPGSQATGMLTFYNGSFLQRTISAGTIFTSKDGVQIVNDMTVIIPAAKPPSEGSVSVTAHAIKAGISGNIKASDIHYTCCVANDYIFVENLSPFKGGKDEQHFSVVKRADIDGVEAQLTQQAKTPLLAQVHSNEQLVNPPQCINKVSSNHSKGDRAPSVLVTDTVTCSAEVYDQQAAEAIAADLLILDAQKTLGKSYKLVKKKAPSIRQVIITDPKKGALSLFIETEGVWLSS